MYDIFFITKQDKSEQFNKLKDQFMFARSVKTFEDAQRLALTEFFWVVWDDLQLREDFDFSYIPDNWSKKYTHTFLNSTYYDGVVLVPKIANISSEEIETRNFLNHKRVEIVASDPVPYDTFEINTYDDYIQALSESKTDMFWATHPSIKFVDNFEFMYFSHNNVYDRSHNHTFKHRFNGGESYNGVFLLTKKKTVSKRELTYRFLVNAKEWDIVASEPKGYEIFNCSSYEDYLGALASSESEMFWVIPDDVEVLPSFKFDYYVGLNDEYSRTVTHIFLNGNSYNGVMLCSKHRPITEYEYNRSYIANRIEVPIVASTPKSYEIFFTSSYQDYLDAKTKSKFKYFWIVPNHVEPVSDFDFSTQELDFPDERSRNITHVFLNGSSYNGIMLCSRNVEISKREYDFNYILDRIEVPVLASKSKKFDVFYTKTYEDYLEANQKSKTRHFWVVPDHISVIPNFDFNIDIDLTNERSRNVTHVFLNGKYNDGAMLCTQAAVLSKREYEFNYIANRIDEPVMASTPKQFDIVFISYQEPNADENYKNLLSRFPLAKRIHGVKGIHQAHIEAAKICDTEMFWIVDGDAIVDDNFNFDFQVPKWEFDTVHVWRSINPINRLIYGYGGIKLFPRLLTLNMDTSKPDMTTSITNKFKAINDISNITAFNTDPFNTWKSAFRECCKLSSKVIDRQREDETNSRLHTWCTVGEDQLYGKYAISGAKAGARFGAANASNLDELKKINDFNWLKEQFDASHT